MARRLTGGLLAAVLVVGLGPATVPGATPGATAAGSCDTTPVAGPTVTVLVMGDSLSHGYAGDYTWRYRFWKAQRDRGVNISFVGPYDGLMATWVPPGQTMQNPNTLYADPCFDQHHFAYGGKDLANTLKPFAWDTHEPKHSEVAWATETYQPDVVIGLMGYNDLKPADVSYDPNKGTHNYTPAQLLANAQQLVGDVRAVKPGTRVVLSTVAPTSPPQVDVSAKATAYNAMLVDAVPEWSTPEDPVGLIDITQDWKGVADTWEGYHPNANGEMHLAWAVADGLDDPALELAVAPLPRPIPVVPLGPRTPGTLTVTGGTPSSVSFTWSFPPGADRQVLYQREAGGAWTKVHDERYATGTTVSGLGEKQYEFRIQAAKGTALAQTDDLQPLYSDPVEVDLVPFGEVGSPQAVGAHHAVVASWTAASGAEHYVVRARRVWPSTSAWVAVTTTSTSQTFPRVAAGALYQVTVTPVRKSISGPTTSPVSARSRGTVNPPVPRPVVTKVAGKRLRVTWKRAAEATRYQVLIRPTGGSWRTLGWSSATRLTSGRLVKGRTYAVRVVAWDSYVAGRTSAPTRFRVR